MISYLKGKIIKRGGNFVILNNADIGYKIFIGESALADLANAPEAEFWIYQNIRSGPSWEAPTPSALNPICFSSSILYGAWA